MANWFYYDASGEKVGPIRGSALKALAHQGAITPDTVVENDEGRSGIARKIQGLVFPEAVTPQGITLDDLIVGMPPQHSEVYAVAAPKPAEVNPFTGTMPLTDSNPFTAAMPAVKKAAVSPQNVPVPFTQEHQTTPSWLIIGSIGRIVGAVIMVLLLVGGLSFVARQGGFEHYDDPLQNPRTAPTDFVSGVISDFMQGITPNNQRGYVEQYRVPLSKVNRNKYKNVLLLHEAVSATNTDMSIGKSLAYENAFREEYERRLRPLISASINECKKDVKYCSSFENWERRHGR